MAQQVGIWLDRSNAIVVSIVNGVAKTDTIDSDIAETRHPLSSTKGHCTIIPESHIRHRRDEFVKRFYRRIIQSIRNAETIFIFGPGAAKKELISEIGRIKGLRSRVIDMETTDKMAPRQAELKVLGFYAMRVSESTP
ncbi:MAG TPA: hypothetical protein DCZ94_05860 [Lentisphaeria bacterium]|nr:MAG: hypothetical protein A2X48_07375 [Lentisphaerae bacterium GWF2_49_21]HBC86461.1 hypothetical protein [Lentisphaeria bacterium]